MKVSFVLRISHKHGPLSLAYLVPIHFSNHILHYTPHSFLSYTLTDLSVHKLHHSASCQRAFVHAVLSV